MQRTIAIAISSLLLLNVAQEVSLSRSANTLEGVVQGVEADRPVVTQALLPPRTGVVTGIVRTKQGQPVSQVRVAVTPAGGELASVLMESLALTDTEGRFRLENITPGRYHVIFGRGTPSQFHPGVVEAAKATVVEVTAGSTIMISDFVEVRSSISGRVVDLATGAGRSVASLTICCDTGKFEGSSTSGMAEYTAKIAPDGTFNFASIPPGEYTVHAFDPEIKSVAQPISVKEEDISGVQIAVSPPVVVDGTVVDRNGNPVAVTARLRPHSDNKTVESFRPPTGMATVSVSFGPPSAPGMPVIVVTQTVSSFLSKKPEPFKTSSVGTDGKFSFADVLPGKYVLEIGALAATLMEQTVEVGANGLRDFLVELSVVPVRGRVIASGGASLPKLTGSVRVVKTNALDAIQYAFPDETGRFTLLLDAGSYRIFPQSLGRSLVSVTMGSGNLPEDIFSFDGVKADEITVTIEP